MLKQFFRLVRTVIYTYRVYSRILLYLLPFASLELNFYEINDDLVILWSVCCRLKWNRNIETEEIEK